MLVSVTLPTLNFPGWPGTEGRGQNSQSGLVLSASQSVSAVTVTGAVLFWKLKAQKTSSSQTTPSNE